ncbi:MULTISPECIES: hypothetical protein [Tenacibaculum]|uniref:hypothetical protein n=1 Tax=Tenacibaculum TaxID=104267 RepID=UPI001F0B2ACD|nr:MULTISPECIES: hypothetical protein [Tenacibaculum]MCH3881522.1 hypothetical protein [Tenacibaculum aquimarinum]MCH3883586.1 hypothetical protein [Tenacibaculum aquimarinum]MDO6598883.1 hypothetical protein [Tenacibaculum sp. 1_MG-2023]
MRNYIKNIFICLTLISAIAFTSCDNSEDGLPVELTIEEKVQVLESDEWLLKGFEDRVMHTYADGKQFTFYGTDSVFGQAIPVTEAYVIEGDLLTFDFNFGNIFTYDLKVSCDNNIVEFFKDGELNKTLYKRGSNYEECL